MPILTASPNSQANAKHSDLQNLAPASTLLLSGANRLDGVDCLRALAILCVLMNHVNMRLVIAGLPFTVGLPQQLISSLFWKGQEGVQIFFAVSGFLITSMALRRWGQLATMPLRPFYALRMARILPLLFSLLAVLCALHALQVRDFVVKAETGGLGRALFAALTFHVGWLEATRHYLPGSWDVLWSLGVEEVFYLGFPLLCLLLGRGRRIVPLAAVLVVFVALGPFARTVWAGNNEVWREYSYLGGMDAIAMGCLTALAGARWQLQPPLLRAIGLAGGLLLTLCLGGSKLLWQIGLSRCGLSMTLVALATCLLLTAAAQSEWRAPCLLAPLLVLGRSSYEIYLTHMFVVFALFHGFVALGSPLPLVAPLFATTIGLAGTLGWLVAHTGSEPANRALRRWLVPGQALKS